MDDRPIALGVAVLCGLPLMLVGLAFLRNNGVVIGIMMPLMQVLSFFTGTLSSANDEDLSVRDAAKIGWAFLGTGGLVAIMIVGYVIFTSTS